MPIGDAFHATAAETAWLIAALYLATSVGQPLMGRLADIYGAVPVFYAGLILTSIAGIGGSFAGSLDVLIGWRVVLGLGTSAAYPAAMILLRRFAADDGGRLHGAALSAVTIAGQVSIVIGPTLGGLLVLAGGWRATIIAVVPVALCAGVLGAFWLPRETMLRDRRASIRDVDFPGIATFAAGLTLMLVALLHPQSASIFVIIASIVSFAIWIAIERRSTTPFIDVRMFARTLRLVALYGRYVIIYTIFYAIFYGLPQWLEQSHRSSPAQAGLFMLPTSIVAIACATIAPRLRPKRSLLVGCAGALIGALFLRQLHAQSSAYAILGVNAIFGIPNGMNPVSEQATLAMHADVRHMGVASGLLRTAGYIGAMLASALIALTFTAGATDGSLEHLAAIVVVLAALLVAISGARLLRPSSE